MKFVEALRVSFDRNDVRDIRGKILLIGNTGLNPNDGIMALWEEDSIVHMFSGDDGSWYRIFSFNKYWLNLIILGMETFQKGSK